MALDNENSLQGLNSSDSGNNLPIVDRDDYVIEEREEKVFVKGGRYEIWRVRIVKDFKRKVSYWNYCGRVE